MADDERPFDDDETMLAPDDGDAPEDGGRPDDRIDDARMDEENTLKPDFVRAVRDALEDGEKGAVYDLVEPLHPADVADLLELLERDERHRLAEAITDLMTSDVVAELNDYVRDEMMEALPADAVAQIAEQLETDDARYLRSVGDEDGARKLEETRAEEVPEAPALSACQAKDRAIERLRRELLVVEAFYSACF